MITRSFAAGEAARLTGVPYRTLDFWDRSGFLRPSIATAAGKGSDRQYSFRDLVALRTASELRRAGISLQALRRVVERVRDLGDIESPLSERQLVIIDGDVILVDNGELLSLVRRPRQLYLPVIVLSVDTIVGELRDRLAA